MIKTLDELKIKLAVCPKSRMAVVAAQEAHTLEAVMKATADGLVKPILLGNAEQTKRILIELGYSTDGVEIIDIATPEECAVTAARLAAEGRVDSIMKGKVETGVVMKVMLDKANGLRKRNVLSGFGLFETPYYHKVFGITDIALNLYPNLEQKKAILENALDVFHALGVENPKVAVVAAVENVNPKMQETVDASELCKMAEAGEITGCTIAGPISVDLAMDPESAAIKGYSSSVAGDADLLLVPDISSGNIAAKLVTSVAGGRTCGIMIGAKVPLIVLSRAATADDKYMSIVLSALVGSQLSSEGGQNK